MLSLLAVVTVTTASLTGAPQRSTLTLTTRPPVAAAAGASAGTAVVKAGGAALAPDDGSTAAFVGGFRGGSRVSTSTSPDPRGPSTCAPTFVPWPYVKATL